MKSAVRRATAVAVFVTIPLGAAACGGDEKSSTTATQPATSKSSTAGTPSASSGSSTAAAPSASNKPSKADVESGMVKILSEGKPSKTVTEGSKCLVDETYSKLSAPALSSIAKADEKARDLTAADKRALRAATDVCAKKVSK